MKNSLHPAWLLCGLVIATAATAAEPQHDTTYLDFNGVQVGIDSKTGKIRPLTSTEQKELAAAVRKGHGKSPFGQPATEAEAKATLRKGPGGEMSMLVPDSLLSSMTVQTDAQGQLVFGEHRGTTQPATATEGQPNE